MILFSIGRKGYIEGMGGEGALACMDLDGQGWERKETRLCVGACCRLGGSAYLYKRTLLIPSCVDKA